MSSTSEIEPISSDELLLRKIPVSQEWFDLAVSTQPSSEAFNPRKDDLTGISMDREQSGDHPDFRSVAEAGQGRSKQGYYVAVLRVGDLRAEGIEVAPRPVENNPGHVELPQLNSVNKKSNEALELKHKLVKLTLRVEGPFVNPPD